MRLLSIVVPVFNEEESLEVLADQIKSAMEQAHLAFEVHFVDDGSRDQSWSRILKISSEDRRFHGTRFRRNFGKAAALGHGFLHCSGDIVATLDADLQDDPAELPQMIALMDNGLDLVSGWKKRRNDPWHKVFPSRVFNGMISWMTGVRLHDHNCGIKVYRTEVASEIPLYGELHRFIPVLAAARGFRVGEKVVVHRSRKFGVSKYGFIRFLRGFLDLLTVTFMTRFSQRPQHFLGVIGLICFVGGLFSLGYLAITWLIRFWNPQAFLPLHERPLVIYAIGSLLLGAQFLSMGFLAEMIAAVQLAPRQNPSIRETTANQAGRVDS
jgi:dolichol-phosphate mannosyltransferase